MNFPRKLPSLLFVLLSAPAFAATERLVLAKQDTTYNSCDIRLIDGLSQVGKPAYTLTYVIKPTSPSAYLQIIPDTLRSDADRRLTVLEGEGATSTRLAEYGASSPGVVATTAPGKAMTLKMSIPSNKFEFMGSFRVRCMEHPQPATVAQVTAVSRAEDGVFLQWPASTTTGVRYRITRTIASASVVLDTVADTSFIDPLNAKGLAQYALTILKDSFVVPGPRVYAQPGTLFAKDGLVYNTCNTELGLYGYRSWGFPTRRLVREKMTLFPRVAGRKLSAWTTSYVRREAGQLHRVRIFDGPDTSRFIKEISDVADLGGVMARDPSGALTFVFDALDDGSSVIRLDVACGPPGVTNLEAGMRNGNAVAATWTDNSMGRLGVEILAAWEDMTPRPVDTIPAGTTHWRLEDLPAGRRLYVSARTLDGAVAGPITTATVSSDIISGKSDSVVTSCKTRVGSLVLGSDRTLFLPSTDQDTLRIGSLYLTPAKGDTIEVYHQDSTKPMASYTAQLSNGPAFIASGPGRGLAFLRKGAGTSTMSFSVSCYPSLGGIGIGMRTVSDPVKGTGISLPIQDGSFVVYGSDNPFRGFRPIDTVVIAGPISRDWFPDALPSDTLWVSGRLFTSTNVSYFSSTHMIPPRGQTGIGRRATGQTVRWQGRILLLPEPSKVRILDASGRTLSIQEGREIHVPASQTILWVHSRWGTFTLSPLAR